MKETLVYGASWCADCRRAKKFLADQRVPYAWHDIEAGARAACDLIQEQQRRQEHHPDDRVPRRLASGRAHERGARATSSGSTATGDAARVRPDHRWRWARGTHHLDLRGPREPRDADHRLEGARRAGGRHRAARQLPRLPRGDRRRRARRPDRAAGAALRRRDAAGPVGHVDLAIDDRTTTSSRSTTANDDHYHARAVLLATGLVLPAHRRRRARTT